MTSLIGDAGKVLSDMHFFNFMSVVILPLCVELCFKDLGNYDSTLEKKRSIFH